MAISKCNCGNTTFEMVENTPIGSSYRVNFIQCSKCGNVVGVMDYFNIGTKANNIETALNGLNSDIRNIHNDIYNIQSKLR